MKTLQGRVRGGLKAANLRTMRIITQVYILVLTPESPLCLGNALLNPSPSISLSVKSKSHQLAFPYS